MLHLANGHAMCNRQNYFCPTKVTFVLQKLILSWQSYFLSNKTYFSWQKQCCRDGVLISKMLHLVNGHAMMSNRQKYLYREKYLCTKRLLLSDKSYFCRQKRLLSWQNLLLSTNVWMLQAPHRRQHNHLHRLGPFLLIREKLSSVLTN